MDVHRALFLYNFLYIDIIPERSASGLWTGMRVLT